MHFFEFYSDNIRFINAQEEKQTYEYKNIKEKLYKSNAAIWYRGCYRNKIQERASVWVYYTTYHGPYNIKNTHGYFESSYIKFIPFRIVTAKSGKENFQKLSDFLENFQNLSDFPENFQNLSDFLENFQNLSDFMENFQNLSDFLDNFR